jgi:hypothetical protein
MSEMRLQTPGAGHHFLLAGTNRARLDCSVACLPEVRPEGRYSAARSSLRLIACGKPCPFPSNTCKKRLPARFSGTQPGSTIEGRHVLAETTTHERCFHSTPECPQWRSSAGYKISALYLIWYRQSLTTVLDCGSSISAPMLVIAFGGEPMANICRRGVLDCPAVHPRGCCGLCSATIWNARLIM